jgi:hypothetical protein
VIEVGEVGAEEQAILAQVLDRLRQERLVRLDGDQALAAEVGRRRHLHAASHLAGQVRVLLVQSP